MIADSRFVTRSAMRWAVVIAALASTAASASGKFERVTRRTPSTLPSRGPADAPVIVELFLAPTHSRDFDEYRAVESLRARHPSRIRLVYRIVEATDTAPWHYAALEAHAQGKFDGFLDAIRKKAGPVTRPGLVEAARSVGIDPQRLADVFSNPPPSYDRLLKDNLRRLRRKFRGTPPFVLINGRRLADGSTLPADLERQYLAALAQAADLIDRGADPRKLAEAFDAEAAPNPLHIAVPSGAPDAVSFQPRLATPALQFSGWPSLGPTDAPLLVAVICNPTNRDCAVALGTARWAQGVFADSVRLVWAPYFDLSAPDATTLTAISAAALCAEAMAPDAEEFGSASSPGWQWVTAMMSDARPALIDFATAKPNRRSNDSRAGPQPLAACRNQRAGSVRAWIARARRAGVVSSPTTMIGGRIYPAITEARTLLQLIESELFPGDCDGCLHLDDFAPTWRE